MYYEEEGQNLFGKQFIVFNKMLYTFCTITHLWTTAIAFSVKGFIVGILTFIFPVFSELFWFFKVGNVIGYNSSYCISVLMSFGPLLLINIFIQYSIDNK